MCPELLRLGPFTLNGYGTMVGVGMVLTWFFLAAEARRKGLAALDRDLGSLYLWMFIPGWIGGKLYFVWSSPEEFAELKRSGDMMKVFGQGFVFYGSLLTCLPVLWWWLRRRSLPVLKSVDVIILAAPLMLGTGRIGCFLAGCCHGHRWDGPLAVTFERGIGLRHVPVHPAQLYETLGCYAIFAWLWFVTRKRLRFDGQMIATYFTLYAVERPLVEWFRGDVGRGFIFGGQGALAGDPPNGLSVSQAISIPVFVLGVVWLVRGLKRARRLAAAGARVR